MARFLFIFLVLALVSEGGHAQSGEPGAGPVSDTSEAETGQADWLLLPYASYAPDTKIATGLVVGYYLPERPGGTASSVQTTITVTQRRQLIAEVSPELYVSGGQWRILGEGKVSHFPNSFYGIGGGTPADAEESYTARYGSIDLSAQRRIRNNLRVGPRLFVRHGRVRDPEEGGLIAQAQVPGADGGTTVGLGLSAFWDARNSLYYPTTGSYAEVVVTGYAPAWGSDYTFRQLTTDVRGYRTVGPGVLAGQVYTESVAGTAPFQLLPLLGGASRLRGYREGRYRDDVYWTTQLEYRFPLFWRLKGTAFASIGEVGPRVDRVLGEHVEAAVGLGGRLRFTEDGVHGRLDIAYSATGLELYISLGEAF